MESTAALPALDPIASTLRTVLRGLMAAIGLFGLDSAQAVAMHRRIARVGQQIERMLVRFRAGKLWRVTERKARSGAFGCAERTLPRRFGWLVRAGGYRAAAYGSQLQTLLAAPEMAELLAVSPAAVRLLRPICRALAFELPGCVAPPRAPKPPRPRSPRPRPEPFHPPLPRGVLSWARRLGYGKLC
jgi:hypothetical protein